MYNEKFVACVRVDGKILREDKDAVYLPFGSEYAIYLKNLNSVRALARVWIDGKEVTEGLRLIVPANGAFDLERFLSTANMDRGNKFKFIERTEKVEQHRGVGAEDGIIRVEFSFEIPSTITITSPIHIHTHTDQNAWRTYPTFGGGLKWGTGYMEDREITFTSSTTRISECANDSGKLYRKGVAQDLSFSNCSATLNEAGITAAGGLSDQKFSFGSYFPTEAQSHVICLRLLGRKGEKSVEQAVSVKRKVKCDTCGTANNQLAKFCTECGTGLELA